MASTLLMNRTNTVQLTRYRDEISGTFIADAVVVADLLTDPRTGPQVAVSPATPGMVLSYSPGTDATYRAQMPNTTPLVEGARYLLRIVASSVFGDQVFERECFARLPR